MTAMSSIELDDHLKVLLLKDLRIQCRARGISPAGSRETLMQSLKENMLETGDWCGPRLTLHLFSPYKSIQSLWSH